MTIREQLEEMAEPGYRQFSAALLPGVDNLLGVRLPALRKLAVSIACGEWRRFLEDTGDDSFEETMLCGMVIGRAEMALPERLERIGSFVPRIGNWSVCDSFCAGLTIARQYPEDMWTFLESYRVSPREYDRRFAAVMLLDYYTDQAHWERAMDALLAIPTEGYYASMAIAWALSVFAVQNLDRVLEKLRKSALDRETRRRTLRKILESRRFDTEEKKRVRMLQAAL